MKGNPPHKYHVLSINNNIIKKGVSTDVEGVNFRVLDAQKNGITIDFVVDMLDNGDKGIAMVKLYGAWQALQSSFKRSPK